MAKKIVVTGGGGYVGWHLCRLLLERGYDVHVLDDILFGRKVIDDFRGNSRFIFQQGDVRNIADLATAFEHADSVIHLAAVVGDPACDKNAEFTRLVNVESSKTVVDLANRFQIERMIFASSCAVYGAASPEILLNEGSYVNPVSLYAETRIISEKIILSGCQGPIPTALRLATAYGFSKRMRFDLAVNCMTLKALTEGRVQVLGGKQYRPFIHCEDAARAFVKVLESPKEKVDREAFNVGSAAQNLRIDQLGEIVAQTLEVPVEVIPQREDDRTYRVDFSKIHLLLGYQAQREIPESVLEIKAAFELGEFDDWKEDRYYNVRYEYML